MNISDLAIATMSLARDDDEERSMRESLQILTSFKIPLFITDGGSNPKFVEFLHSLSNTTILTATTKGLATQVMSSLRAAAASGKKFTCYTEPDKKLFFRDGLESFISQASVDEKTGVVLAARSDKGFDSYPPFQRMTEATINNCTGEITGVAVDYTYGPFLMNSKLVSPISNVPADIAWGWRTYAFGMAHRLGYSISGVVGDYQCPPDHGDDTPALHRYRMKQMCQSVEGALLSVGSK